MIPGAVKGARIVTRTQPHTLDAEAAYEPDIPTARGAVDMDSPYKSMRPSRRLGNFMFRDKENYDNSGLSRAVTVYPEVNGYYT